jgi:hypothetical protein
MDPEEEQLKFERKRASQTGLLLGGIALALGAVACLAYLLVFKPWKFNSPQYTSPINSTPNLQP